MAIERFNIRVYGLLVNNGRVLVADEIIKGRRITKFPGGGLEFGEGPRECLAREIREELGLEAADVRHFYTTDFFQASAFREGDQIISIYFTFSVLDPMAIDARAEPFDFAEDREETEAFRWLDLSGAKDDDVTLPIDRVVMRMLINPVPPPNLG